ncbi:MAG: T9SS type A sorting domain-containing protein [Flavobacteriales bacterium]|nr:T9SS type A sorting domain-containing protein [Flavobacteriales bacterium]
MDDFTDLGDGITTGFTDRENEKSLLLPNPTRDGFRIRCTTLVRVRVIAPSGALVMEPGRVAPGAFISTDHLDSGVYIVEISDGDVLQHQRLVVE